MPITKNDKIQNDELPYGNCKSCSVCYENLPVISAEIPDVENLLYHGYCSRQCASTAGYHNFQI
jgi:hypothetical protein